ncbi:antibiotic biosynthesis monooxygenase family protein [Streptomyces mauvecolor]|uniref:Antibiotic biosynthesis monooxygenase family protein n=1 Tax=Streptomyces mauvecolor TaxID=58345 RepID=A0ABV9UXU8_9ACTN
MFAQFKEETGPIVLANTFFVPKERTEAFLSLFRRQAEFMKAQPGFVSLQMHKGTADSRLLMNVGYGSRPRRSPQRSAARSSSAWRPSSPTTSCRTRTSSSRSTYDTAAAAGGGQPEKP